jgi:hypothetical protein
VIKLDGLASCVGKIDLIANLFDADFARTIAANYVSACVVSCTSGETRCAGQGAYGQLGNGLELDSKNKLVTATGLRSEVCTPAS